MYGACFLYHLGGIPMKRLMLICVSLAVSLAAVAPQAAASDWCVPPPCLTMFDCAENGPTPCDYCEAVTPLMPGECQIWNS